MGVGGSKNTQGLPGPITTCCHHCLICGHVSKDMFFFFFHFFSDQCCRDLFSPHAGPQTPPLHCVSPLKPHKSPPLPLPHCTQAWPPPSLSYASLPPLPPCHCMQDPPTMPTCHVQALL